MLGGNLIIETQPKIYCRHRHTVETHPKCFYPKGHDYEGIPKEPGEWWKGLKIGFLDIETSGLAADGFTAMMLTWCIKTEGKRELLSDCIDIKDIHNPKVEDRKIIQSLVDILNSHRYGVIATYYGTNFDNKFVRSRAMYHNIKFPVYGELQHLDLYYSVRSKMRLGSNRLESVCDFLGIAGKTKLVWSYWRRAMQGDEKALNYIYDHNKHDVIILERVFHRLKSDIKFTKRSI